MARAPEAGAVIVAPATAPGRGTRGIVRLSGDGLAALLEAAGIVVPAKRGIGPAALTIAGMRNALVVPVLLAWMPGPDSYTGEDSAEIQLPGQPDLVARVVDALIAAGGSAGRSADGLEVRRAEPGEFTARAYLRGRMALTEAEGVAHAIAAQSDAELRAAHQLRSGRLGRLADRLASEVASVLALVEAGIDFTDEEDVVAIEPADVARRVQAVADELSELLDRAVAIERLEATPRVVLVGAANAGKSTLFNALLGRERAIVSSVAGTTRDAIVEPIVVPTPLGPAEVLLVDVAGEESGAGSSQGHARGRDADARQALRAAMQAQAAAASAGADLRLRCVPAGELADPADPADLDAPAVPADSGSHGKTSAAELQVRTKADAAPSGWRPRTAEVAVSAADGRGLDALRHAIAHKLSESVTVLSGTAVALAPRHEARLRAARVACADAMHAPASSPELVAAALRCALDELGAVAGQVTPDDVLGRIFASFCIGK